MGPEAIASLMSSFVSIIRYHKMLKFILLYATYKSSPCELPQT